MSNQQTNQPPQSKFPVLGPLDFLMIAWTTWALFSLFVAQSAQLLSYSQFLNDVNEGRVHSVVVRDKTIEGELEAEKGKIKPFRTYRMEDPDLLKTLTAKHITFTGAADSSFATTLTWIIVVVFGLGIIGSLMSNKREGGGMGPLSAFSAIERHHARLYAEHNIKTTFADVAGADEAKEELAEVVTFLKKPQDYSKLGGRLPKGILLVGPPGTGKTLLARAVAGEANVPFFSISGSEFVELFVGVGAARVRDLFAQARQKAPCIIFIDELDALGRSRAGANLPGVHDEKEQTLNQLLVELDGFDTTSGVVLLAATNRPEILDEALLRAGRFDRQVAVDRPDKVGRAEILKVHLRKVVAAPNLNIEHLAALTPGCTGADLANMVNEAALLAARRNATAVEQCDFDNALERMVAGVERRTRLLSRRERRTVAFHEMGHALVAIALGGTDEVQKVSIIPRGVSALGYTVQRPVEDRFLLSRTELQNKLAALMGGRAAEVMIFGEETTGAADDLQKATDLAKAMVMRYGMDNRIGLVAVAQPDGKYLVGAGLTNSGSAPETAREIDCAVRDMLREAFECATDILTKNRDWLERAAQQLLHDETLNLEQIMDCQQERKLPIIVQEARVL
jgi:cell division protease FtsH